MPLYLEDEDSDEVFYADNTSKPKMGVRGGHTWDSANMYIDGEQVSLYLDSTWGDYGYFEYDDTCYKLPLNGLKRLPPLSNNDMNIIDPWNTEMKYQNIKRNEFLGRKDENQPGPYE